MSTASYDQRMAVPENSSSPLAEALARVGDRWTLLVVEAMLAALAGSATCSARSRVSRPISCPSA